MKILISSILILIQLVSILGFPSLTPFPNKCCITDSKCLTAQLQGLTPIITDGDPAMGAERLDTMSIDTVKIVKEDFNFIYTNLHIKGFKASIIDNVVIDNDSKIVRIMFHTDISTTGLYSGKGTLFSMPLAGDGDMRYKLENVEFVMYIPFAIIKDIHGTDIMDLKEYYYTYDVKDSAHFQFDNLYYGDKKASDKMHELINHNWKFITIVFGKPFFDEQCQKLYNTARTYMQSQPIQNIIVL